MKKWRVLLLGLSLFLVSCQPKTEFKSKTNEELLKVVSEYEKNELEGEIFYNIFPISFADSNHDSYGDLNGITASLDYLKSLGIKGIWLNPITPSKTYHKYDVKNYMDIDVQFGTIDDFKNLIKEAHARDMVIIMDMVFNHTSIDHPWFEKSMNDEKGYEDYYIKTKSLDEIKVADKSKWYQHGDYYYYGSFWSEMPELNLESQAVRKELRQVLKFWLDLGVDGFRYDAAKHAYDINEYDSGTPILEKNLQFWMEMREYVKSINPKAYTVAEVWLSNQQMAYYAPGFDSLFNFDFGPGIISSIQNAKSSDFLSPYLKGRQAFLENQNFIDATFLTNHDQNRIGSSFVNQPQRLKLAALLLLTLPGTPFIYYGEELGYQGVKPDERIREPYQWGDDRAPRWETIELNKDTASVSEQLQDEQSLLACYQKLGSYRSQNDVLKKGTFSNVQVGDSRVMVFVRELDGKQVIVMANLDSETRTIQTDLTGQVVLSEGEYTMNEQGYQLSGYGFIVLEK